MAYITATIVQVDPPDPSGDQHLVVQFTGNAGEPAIQRDYTIDENASIVAVRNWVFGVLALLNSRRSNQGLVTVGQVVPPLAPSAAVLTPQDVWAANAQRLVRMQAIVSAGGLDPANAEFVALQANVKSSYVAAYAGAI